MPPETDNTLDPFNTDGQACRMEWQPLPRGEAPDVSDLPPLDYSLFLFHASKYYFGIMNYLIDEKSYLQNLHELYQNPAAKASTSRLWYAQHLLVLAFGKAFVSRKSSRGKPAGHIYAVRAMTLLPSQAEMGPDPLLSVQVLILAAVYLQSVDMRVSAFQYVCVLRIHVIFSSNPSFFRLDKHPVFACASACIATCQKEFSVPMSPNSITLSSGWHISSTPSYLLSWALLRLSKMNKSLHSYPI